jgi:hypothetical protein
VVHSKSRSYYKLKNIKTKNQLLLIQLVFVMVFSQSLENLLIQKFWVN